MCPKSLPLISCQELNVKGSPTWKLKMEGKGNPFNY